MKLEGSLDIIKDLTVDTNTLIVDSALNKVGIGKTPSAITKVLDVNDDINIDGDVFVDGSLLLSFGRVGGSNPTLTGNLFLGFDCGYGALNTASNNTGLGKSSLSAALGGDNNTAIGAFSLFSNTTGSGHTAIGLGSMYDLISGVNNTALGLNSLRTITSGVGNTSVGANSLGYLGTTFTGNNNTSIGNLSGQLVSGSSSRNTFIGDSSGFDTATTYNDSISIGRNSKISASRQLAIGNSIGNRSITDVIIGSLSPDSNAFIPEEINLRVGRTSYTPGTLDVDMNANSLTISGGESTGTGAGGNLVFKTTTSGTTGSTFNALSERLKIDGGDGKITFNNSYSFPTTTGNLNEVLKVDGSGNLVFGTGGGTDTNFALDSLTFDADQTHTLASFDLTLSTTGDASAFKIDGGLGYVGIGIVPTEKFEVLGDSKFVGEIKHSGFYTYLDTEGTNPPLQLHQEVISDIGRLTFEGTTGGLLTIIDDKDNELWTASDVSGNPIGYIDADWLVQFGNPFARPFKIVYNSGDGSSEIFLDLPTVAGTTGSLYVDGSGFVKVAP